MFRSFPSLALHAEWQYVPSLPALFTLHFASRSDLFVDPPPSDPLFLQTSSPSLLPNKARSVDEQRFQHLPTSRAVEIHIIPSYCAAVTVEFVVLHGAAAHHKDSRALIKQPQDSLEAPSSHGSLPPTYRAAVPPTYAGKHGSLIKATSAPFACKINEPRRGPGSTLVLAHRKRPLDRQARY